MEHFQNSGGVVSHFGLFSLQGKGSITCPTWAFQSQSRAESSYIQIQATPGSSAYCFGFGFTVQFWTILIEYCTFYDYKVHFYDGHPGLYFLFAIVGEILVNSVRHLVFNKVNIFTNY